MYPRRLLFSSLVAIALAAPLAAQDNPATLFRNVRVFDGARLLAAQDVLIQSGRIAKMGQSLTPPAGVVMIQAQGKTLLPGLIDAHTHTWGDASKTERRGRELGAVASAAGSAPHCGRPHERTDTLHPRRKRLLGCPGQGAGGGDGAPWETTPSRDLRGFWSNAGGGPRLHPSKCLGVGARRLCVLESAYAAVSRRRADSSGPTNVGQPRIGERLT